MAETFLDEGYELVNTVRNVFMYTGTYKGKKVSIVMLVEWVAHQLVYIVMNCLSSYDVDKIIRVGSTGAYVEDLKLYDTVLVDSAYADSNAFRKLVLNDHSFVAYPSASLNEEIKKSAEKLGIEMKTARTHSSDVFYSSVPLSERIAESQAACVEMESYALFTNAEKLGKQVCLLTNS
nr:purine nucleoside phosphorylase DeoD-type [Mycoplasmopsis bovis]